MAKQVRPPIKGAASSPPGTRSRTPASNGGMPGEESVFPEWLQRYLRPLVTTWRVDLGFRVVVCSLWAALLLSILRVITGALSQDREGLWAADNLDTAVTTGLAFIILLTAIFLGAAVAFPTSAVAQRLRRDLIRAGGAAVIVLTFYAGYASFRNQGRLSSEAALNDNGYTLYQIEMDHEELRCLYFNYAHQRPKQCLDRIVSSDKNWSLALFYVEEAWFQLSQAQKERKEWGATYAEQIQYWAQDVSRDPTGLFSYYLISSEKSLEDAQSTMSSSDVSIKDLCGRYILVWTALGRYGAQPSVVSGAAKQCAVETGSHHGILDRELLVIHDPPTED